MIRDGTGIILAGGKSSRFGSEKALYPWKGRPMIEAVLEKLRRIFPRVLVVAKRTDKFSFLEVPGVKLVRDRFRASHALGGLYSGLCRTDTSYAFVCGCDMPLLKPELVRRLWSMRHGHAAVVPRFSGFLQPLCTVYSRRCVGTIRKRIRLRRFGMQDALRRMPARILPEGSLRKIDSKGLSFRDLDTKRDYRRALFLCRKSSERKSRKR